MGILVLESFCGASGVSQVHPLFVSFLGPLGRNYKVICSCLPLLMGLGALGGGYTVNRGQLPLVLGL